MKFISKINTLFKVQKIKEVDGVEVWIVSWNTVVSYCSLFEKGQRVAKAFLMQEDAEAFAQSLRDAQILLQNTNDINITIKKQL